LVNTAAGSSCRLGPAGGKQTPVADARDALPRRPPSGVAPSRTAGSSRCGTAPRCSCVTHVHRQPYAIPTPGRSPGAAAPCPDDDSTRWPARAEARCTYMRPKTGNASAAREEQIGDSRLGVRQATAGEVRMRRPQARCCAPRAAVRVQKPHRYGSPGHGPGASTRLPTRRTADSAPGAGLRSVPQAQLVSQVSTLSPGS
jgi:hypothetical protein